MLKAVFVCNHGLGLGFFWRPLKTTERIVAVSKTIFSWKGKKKEGKKKESSFLHMDAHAEFAFRKFRRIARFQLGAADRAAALAQLRRLEGSHRQS